MTTRATLTSLAALVLITAAPVLAQSPVSAGGGAMHVWTDNVFGTEPSPGDGITDGRGWLTWTPATAVRLGASGRLLRFQDNEDLNHGYFSLTAEAVPNAPGSRTRWQTGLSSAWRLNADLYEPFDYRDLSGYLSARHYFAPEFSLQLRADASARSYPDASSEDARKLWLTTRLQRSLPTRTSLTLALRAGLKRYRDDVQPGAGVRDINLQVAQSVTPRVALRTWLADAQLFEHGDAAAQMAAFDNPLLDEFSFDGSRFGAAVKVIMPKNVTADLMVERAWLDYPGRPPALYDPLKNEFVLSDGLLALAPGERADDVTRVRLSLERPGVRVGNAARLDLNAAVEWNDQASNDLYWQWNGWSMQAGASVAF